MSLSVFDQQLLACSISERHCSLPIAQDKICPRRANLLHLPIVIERKDILVRLKPIDAVIAISRGKVYAVDSRSQIDAIIPASAAQHTSRSILRNQRIVSCTTHDGTHTRYCNPARCTGRIDNVDISEFRTCSIDTDTVLPHDDRIYLFCGTDIAHIRIILIRIVPIIPSKYIVRRYILTVLNMYFF